MGTDSLYYIRDYSGNYYRINHADQLVTAKSNQDATIFTFFQANERIGAGKKATFYYMVLAEETTDTVESEDDGKEEGVVSSIKELTYDEVRDQIEKNASSYDLSQMDWMEYLTHFAYLVEGLKGYRDELAKKHSDIEQKICDILHYIELCETDDAAAIDLVELLRVCRENRRDIKDELQRIEYFQNNLGTNANALKAKQALRCIKGMEKRTYRPRKYDELFENCVLKDRRLQRDDLCESEDRYESRKKRFDAEPILKTESDEDTMMEERNYTPLDGKENDWYSFAKQQAEFYRNAGQYIVNLRIDIKEIDDEIEDILLESEEANCNVTQGYKVFKRLKALRLERKAKACELNCLYSLTDYIDCEALADTCEANLTEIEDIMDIPKQTAETGTQPVADGSEELHVIEHIEDMAG